MTRDPDALHVDQTVQTPNGVGIIRRRMNGPIVRWVVNDYPYLESQLTPIVRAVPTGISPACHNSRHGACGRGFIYGGQMTECSCPCGHKDGLPGHHERDWKAETCDNQGTKKTARDGEGNTDPGLTDTLSHQERLMSKSTREPASRPPIGGR